MVVEDVRHTEAIEARFAEEMVSYRRNITGVSNVVFISPGYARHAPRIKVAIDPPDSLDPRGGKVAVIGIQDGAFIEGTRPSPELNRQIVRFLSRNRDVILQYWNYEIATDQLEATLRARAADD